MRRLVVLVMAAALLAACSSATASSPGGGERTVVIDVRFSRFSIGDLQVRPGETVRFVVRNGDPIPHELIVGDLAVQDVHEKGTESHHAEKAGEVSVAAGATAETRYTFTKAGTLFFGCHLPGHWAYGMQGLITVK